MTQVSEEGQSGEGGEMAAMEVEGPIKEEEAVVEDARMIKRRKVIEGYLGVVSSKCLGLLVHEWNHHS